MKLLIKVCFSDMYCVKDCSVLVKLVENYGFKEKSVCWPSNLSILGPSSTLGGKEKRIGVGKRKKELRGSLGRGLSNDYVISNFVNMHVTFCDLLQV